MNEFIDIHNHCLHGLDDGAKNQEETKIILEQAYEQGIHTIIATPHFHHQRGSASKEQIAVTLEKTREVIAEHLPLMRLYTGNELYYNSRLGEFLDNNEAYTLADSLYVLVEFSPKADIFEVRKGMYEIQSRGYWPILAHAERLSSLLEDEEAIISLHNMGIYIQINVSSVIGENGWRQKSFVKKLLKYELVHFIATDAHDAKIRRPMMKECAHYLEKKCGRKSAEKYLWEHPQYILDKKML